jgi:hypothetical protein
MDTAKEQHKIVYKSWKTCDGDPGNDLTSVRGRKLEPCKESPNSLRPKKVRQVNSKVMLIVFFDIKKSFPWQAIQSILHTTVTFYGSYMKICEDFAPNVGNKRTGYCIMTMHHLSLPFPPGNFPRLKIKLKGCHFDKNEVIEIPG